MNNVIITLLSQKPSELNKFLSKYFDKEMDVEDGAFMWSCIYNKPLESVSLISTLIDNSEKFKIDALVSMESLNPIKISSSNINDFVKLMYFKYVEQEK